MKISHRPFLTALFAILMNLAFFNLAHAATATASVSKNQVTKDEVFQLRVSIDERVNSDALDLSVLEKDFYLGRPNFGTSMNIVNGNRSVRSEWTISLAPLTLGNLTIPSFDIKGASTSPIRIKVSMDKSAPKQSDMAEFELNLAGDELYPSQSTQLDVKLIIKADPRRLQNPKITPPNANGLEITPIGDSQQYQGIHQGMEVTIVEQSFRITATDSGQFELNGPKLTGAVIYGDRMSGTTKLIQLDTQVKTYNINVLPVPSSYQGSWLPTSNFTLIQTWTDSQGNRLPENQPVELDVGDSVTRTVTMQAEGLTEQQLPNLSVSYPNSVRIYEEKPQFGKTDSGQPIVVFKQVIIPKHSGEIVLPAIEQSWWNTQTKSQQTSKLPELTVQANATEQPASQIVPTTPTPSVQTEVVTVKDAGMWPIWTAIFAALWVVTLIAAAYFWKKSRTGVAELNTKTTAAPTSLEQSLLNAIEQQDALKVQNEFAKWTALHPNLDPTLKVKALNEIAELHHKLYSGQSQHEAQPWPAETLKSLITNTKKYTQEPQSPLAPL
ncbi:MULTISPECIES: BatD family protein [Vibrio]|uniref:BatD family protein n=1 Tax=Vibrio TaxID=662 RepID=UPI001FCB7048|nr:MULTISPECIES: BatD family protein [Vibrio]